MRAEALEQIILLNAPIDYILGAGRQQSRDFTLYTTPSGEIYL
jgi:hypothetical protein